MFSLADVASHYMIRKDDEKSDLKFVVPCAMAGGKCVCVCVWCAWGVGGFCVSPLLFLLLPFRQDPPA